jgi:hypothetical protein
VAEAAGASDGTQACNGFAGRGTQPPADFAILTPTWFWNLVEENMSKHHGTAREPDPTEAFGGTAPLEVDQRPGREADHAEHRPEETLGAGSAALPPRSLEDIPTTTVAELVGTKPEQER